MGAQLRKFTKYQLIISLKWVNSIVCKLCFDKAVVVSTLQASMNPLPKFSLDFKTDDATHKPRGHEKIYYSRTEAFWR